AVEAEPYALWAIEAKGGGGHLFRHPAVRVTEDVKPFFLRKVRILNAAHTAMCALAVPRGVALVREAMADPDIDAWLRRLLFEEIVPVLAGRVEGPEGFAHQTIERVQDPFLDHKFSDILTYHDQKVTIRLAPTRDEFRAKFGREPPLLSAAIAWAEARASVGEGLCGDLACRRKKIGRRRSLRKPRKAPADGPI